MILRLKATVIGMTCGSEFLDSLPRIHLRLPDSGGGESLSIPVALPEALELLGREIEVTVTQVYSGITIGERVHVTEILGALRRLYEAGQNVAPLPGRNEEAWSESLMAALRVLTKYKA